MSTRSLTILQDDSGREIAVLYRHCDGYPTGHGVELAEFLRPLTPANGAGPRGSYNGLDELACDIIAHFKPSQGGGGYYLYPAGTRDCGEEWTYTVRHDDKDRLVIDVKPDYDGWTEAKGLSPAELIAQAKTIESQED